MSSLFSALNLLSGLREYSYRGFQQLPLVLIGISFLFTATTGSVAFLNVLIGMIFVVPVATIILQKAVGFVGFQFPNLNFALSRSDVCGLVPPEGKSLELYIPKATDGTPIPSFWLMQTMFFFGFLISNAVECLTAASNCPDSDAAERRKYHSLYVLVMLLLLLVVVLTIRFRYMPSCELSGLNFKGDILKIIENSIYVIMIVGIFGGAAGSIGYGMYTLSRKCGARTGDLLGILSQFLPPTAYSQAPVVCTTE